MLSLKYEIEIINFNEQNHSTKDLYTLNWGVQKSKFVSKNKIEDASIWEDAFYQSEWVKINASWVVLVFSLYVYCC